MNQNYEAYYLKGNPFPPTAIVDINSKDIRINGNIFYEKVFSEEIRELRKKIESRTNMIYVAGLKFDKGIGKSAILVHEWRRLYNLSKSERITSVYVRCSNTAPNNKPQGMCSSIVIGFHKLNYLWGAFKTVIIKYLNKRPSLEVSKEAVDILFNVYKTPPERLPFTIYTHIFDTQLFAEKLAEWLAEKCDADIDILSFWLNIYLNTPNLLPRKIVRIRMDKIELYKQFLSVMEFAGFRYHYIFLDQMEDAIMATPTPKMGEFCLGMRRILEASSGRATIIVTLHPDSEMKLSTKGSEHLTTLAPLDAIHRVDVMNLDKKSELVVPLTAEYMKYFRMNETHSLTYPIDPKVIRFICYLKNGNIREILQQLHQCIKFGSSNGNPYIDIDFIRLHPEETLGSLIDEKKLNEFESS